MQPSYSCSISIIQHVFWLAWSAYPYLHGIPRCRYRLFYCAAQQMLPPYVSFSSSVPVQTNGKAREKMRCFNAKYLLSTLHLRRTNLLRPPACLPLPIARCVRTLLARSNRHFRSTPIRRLCITARRRSGRGRRCIPIAPCELWRSRGSWWMQHLARGLLSR